jgi:hypothetical protein
VVKQIPQQTSRGQLGLFAKFEANLSKKFVNFFFQMLQGFLGLFDKSELAFMGEVRDNVEFLFNFLELNPWN